MVSLGLCFKNLNIICICNDKMCLEKIRKSLLSLMVKVKVTRLLSLVLLERASIVQNSTNKQTGQNKYRGIRMIPV